MHTKLSKSYSSNFDDSNFDIVPFIEVWPIGFGQNKITKWMNLKHASMILVPVIKDTSNEENKEKISKEYFYCSKCKKWIKTFESVKNIKRHAAIHVPETFKKITKKTTIFTGMLAEDQENKIIRNLIGFVLFDAGSFQLIESQFLSNILDSIPKREKIVVALENISKDTQNEITQLLKLSSANSITFDEWTDKRERKYLGITIRSFIEGDYSDYFLDLIRLTSEINDSTVLSNEILKSLLHYQLNINDIISCTTDNCSLMVKTASNLGLWRIPCLCYVLNLIFQTFVLKLRNKIKARNIRISLIEKKKWEYA